MTGEINGVKCKIKMDYDVPGERIVDFKTTKDFELQWDGRQKVPFIEFWRYDIQAAFYQTIEGNKLPYIIAAVTKEDEPDIEALIIPQARISQCLDIIEQNIERFDDIKKGLIEPKRCEKCPYCKNTKVLKEAISYFDKNW